LLPAAAYLLLAVVLSHTLPASVLNLPMRFGDEELPAVGWYLGMPTTFINIMLVAVFGMSGIDSKDIQTQFVSVDPRYDDSGQNLVGYNAANSVSATMRDLASVGDVIDTAVAAGANNVSGPSLSRDDQDQLYRDALEDAVAKARLKATMLARAAGRTLGEIRAVSEQNMSSGPIAYGAYDMKAAAGSSTPIEPGTTEVTASVQVVFALS
jgi:uncharacterized protein YggE